MVLCNGAHIVFCPASHGGQTSETIKVTIGWVRAFRTRPAAFCCKELNLPHAVGSGAEVLKMKKPDFKNMWKATKKKSLHLRKSSLWMGAFLVVFLIVLSCGVLFAGESEPENPIGDKSDSFDTASVIMNCESDEDDKVYVPVPVATEPDQSTESEQSSSGVNGQEEQQQDPKEEDPQQEEQQTPPEQAPQEEKITKPAASARSDKNNNAAPNGGGGTSGGTDPSGEKADKVYFTTTIKDGETVTEKALSFQVKHKYDELKPTKFTVSVNGTEVPQNSLTSCKVELIEGENTIRVAVTYLDSTGKVVATPYKDYKVILNTKDLVIDTDLQDGASVTEELFSFNATASYKDTAATLTVQLNGSTVKSKGNGKYQVRLKADKNTFTLVAKGGDLSKTEIYTVTYKNSGEFSIKTDIDDSKPVIGEAYSFNAWLQNASSNASLQVTVNNKTVRGKNGFYSVTLKFGSNKIILNARDGEKPAKLEYDIKMERKEASREEQFPDGDRSPKIKKIDITDGMETNSSTMNMTVHAVDYKGNNLNANNMLVYINDSPVINPWLNGGAQTFRMNFTSGKNLVVVKLEDSEGHQAYYEYNVTYTPITGPVGNALVSVEATTVGLGYIIPPTSVPFYDDEPASYVVDRLLKESGITYDYGGSFDNGFYLQRIYKQGLMANFSIPEKLRQYIDDYGVFLEENKYELDSLGEKDFIPSGSGWMVAVDGLYTGYGFSDMRLKNGSVVKVRFTLYMGKDIGDNSAASEGQTFPEIFVEP